MLWFFFSLNHGQQISTNSDIYPTGMLRLNGGNGGVLKRMVSALRRPEAQGALSWQANPVSGDVEADATTLRKFKSKGGTSVLFQFTQRLQLCVFKQKNESICTKWWFSCQDWLGSSSLVWWKEQREVAPRKFIYIFFHWKKLLQRRSRHKKVLEEFYRQKLFWMCIAKILLATARGWLAMALGLTRVSPPSLVSSMARATTSCNHVRGQCVRKFRRGRRFVKNRIPFSLSATIKGHKHNPQLLLYARQWQWRFVQRQDLFQATGKRLYAEAFGWKGLQQTRWSNRKQGTWRNIKNLAKDPGFWKGTINKSMVFWGVNDVILHGPASTKCTAMVASQIRNLGWAV